jgi:hypothetical protein
VMLSVCRTSLLLACILVSACMFAILCLLSSFCVLLFQPLWVGGCYGVTSGV